MIYLIKVERNHHGKRIGIKGEKMTEQEYEEYQRYIEELLSDERISKMDEFIQHGNTTTLAHCKAVAKLCGEIAYRYHIKVDVKSLARGALLHDYFLYDWHEQKLGNLHGFYHPGIALKNATRDFELNPREQDIIRKHMFPLTLYVPRYRETVLVCLADKGCALKEVYHRIFRGRFASA